MRKITILFAALLSLMGTTVKAETADFENELPQGWEAVGEPEVKGCAATALLKNDEEFNNFFIISNGKDHTVSGSVKYDKEMAAVYDAYVTPIIYSIRVK